jgi:mono/diheme cytochrome c family protein
MAPHRRRAYLAGLVLTLLTAVSTAATLTLHPTRQSPDDLEVTGLLAGLPANTAAYVPYHELAALPQVTVHVTNDENFPAGGRGVLVTGIPLDSLARALGALPDSDLIDALCTDDYRAHYPASYIAQHHPIFALLIDHQRPSAWAARTHLYDPGPYFLTHAHFVPIVNILAYSEQPQVPTNVIRLNFSTTAATYGAITPHGPSAQDPAVQQGFAIARQSCLRCHYQGAYGGTKSGRDWTALSTWAREQPDYFMRYVHNPQSVEPHAHMPPNPGYDHATLSALTAYFRTFTQPPTTPH